VLGGREGVKKELVGELAGDVESGVIHGTTEEFDEGN